MKVTVQAATEYPIDIISMAAGTSYRRDDASYSRLKHCFKNGHMSVFEHAIVTLKIEGISRACSHQLVRHRMASFVQESQRYTKIEGDDWYVMPPEIECYEGWFKDQMNQAIANYEGALSVGIKPEDARYILPEATKTNITMTMNVRELFHFLDLRLDKAAQWEIRGMAEEMLKVITDYNQQWAILLDLYKMKLLQQNGAV